MKTAIFVALLLPMAALGKETAYQALRTVGAERSQALLNNVIEVKGRNGTPQPASWLVLINDPLARGGVREIEVSKGHIISERTPVKSYSGQGDAIVLNFKMLNLDSEGAFTVAESEARNAKIGFFGADFLLRADDAGNVPIWVVQLLDADKRSLGSVSIAANTGTVISSTFGGKTTKGNRVPGDSLKTRLLRFTGAVGRSIRHAGEGLENAVTDDNPPR